MFAFGTLVFIVVFFILCWIFKANPDSEDETGCIYFISIAAAIFLTVWACNQLY